MVRYAEGQKHCKPDHKHEAVRLLNGTAAPKAPSSPNQTQMKELDEPFLSLRGSGFPHHFQDSSRICL